MPDHLVVNHIDSLRTKAHWSIVSNWSKVIQFDNGFRGLLGFGEFTICQ